MRYISLLLLVLVFNCKNEIKTSKPLTANEIVDKSIDVSGGIVYDTVAAVIINFDFRSLGYRSVYSSEGKVLRRHIFKEEDTILDFLKGNQFQRYINKIPVKVPDSMIPRYSASVNSVHYFSVLPYGLNDKAVNKELIGEEQIKANNYYKVKVTFDEEGGGEDFEDVFIYWINKKTYKADYLAYSYNEDDDVGMRFREAYNERYVKGLRFVDYNNYKSEDESVSLLELGNAFDTNKLKLLSMIELENVDVGLIDD
ncbi:MAG: deoxyribose-phosphate aldolase [Winogradskyella sp.]|uniref:DUF6503 family protein n=1 Tax=Winogradskyella sp. TaxID=1883156 RepID=UPI000F3CB868|nr:DUF6503 family protein [Winogradskyella sp.]RNC79816.1 MAG: deoxyribose-phosphate aldolase [Winogradskyella sp.]